MQKVPCLIPNPRSMKFTEGISAFLNKSIILLQSDRPQNTIFSALFIKKSIQSGYNKEFDISASASVPPELVGIRLVIDPRIKENAQGYRLTIAPDIIDIQAKDEPGLWYACCTLAQLIQYYASPGESSHITSEGYIPCLEISDWPDFRNRGVMLDVSRDKVPKMDTIFNLVDLLASWKINQLQLYMEHTFAYQQYPEVWKDASPFTAEEILVIDRYCRERFIELVPNQNSFGHLEHWLKLAQFKHLAEAPNGFEFPWGYHPGPFSLCPLDEGSLALLKNLYDELLPHFSSRQFNIGCDETFDLGQGRSKAECERVGNERVYLDFLFKIYDEVRKRGFRMQFWSDMIINHPELIGELPKDVIALEWGYEADHPFADHGEILATAGLSFYVCPGTSSWNSIAGRTDNCLRNLSNAAQNGIKYGADGYLITDWGDNGHWQVLPISYLGFAGGAAYSWCFKANQSLDIAEVTNQYAFMDTSGDMGKLAYKLGNIYHLAGIEPPNSSALFHILQKPIKELKDYLEPERAILALKHSLEEIDRLSSLIASVNSTRPDGELLQREFIQTITLLQHACKRGIFGFSSTEYPKAQLLEELKNIIAEYKQIWLARNRPGGLADSLSYFEKSMRDYQ